MSETLNPFTTHADSAQNPVHEEDAAAPTRSRGEGGRKGDAADVYARTAALGPEDRDDGVGEAAPLEPRGGGEPLRRGRVHLAVRAHHLRRVALAAGSLDAPRRRRGHRSSPLGRRRRTERSNPRVACSRAQQRGDAQAGRQAGRQVSRCAAVGGFIRGFMEGIGIEKRRMDCDAHPGASKPYVATTARRIRDSKKKKQITTTRIRIPIALLSSDYYSS